MNLKFNILKGSFTIHRLSHDDNIPDTVVESSFYCVCKTDQELSIVCPSSQPINSEKFEDGWSCVKVVGPLDFTLTGIIANISGLLAEVGISIFALSTFDTDYILVKSETLEQAKEVLSNAGHTFLE